MEGTGSLLVVIIDTNPVWWGKNALGKGQELLFSQCLDAIMVFCNSHLMLSHRNKLAVLAAHVNGSQFLFPRRVLSSEDLDTGTGDAVSRGELDGKYELFGQVDNAIKDEIKDLILNDRSSEKYNDSLIAGSLSMALCYIHRLEKEILVGETLNSRIVVVKGSEDNPSQYMNLMNVVFTAQKLNVMIDACILENDSGLLQQACDITGGIYIKVPQLQGLVQYLLWIFLASGESRQKLSLPPKTQVDYRAACFCHRQLIDIGYVCSVCLSIFCTFSPICSTCQTTFKFLGPQKPAKKKKKT